MHTAPVKEQPALTIVLEHEDESGHLWGDGQ